MSTIGMLLRERFSELPWTAVSIAETLSTAPFRKPVAAPIKRCRGIQHTGAVSLVERHATRGGDHLTTGVTT